MSDYIVRDLAFLDFADAEESVNSGYVRFTITDLSTLTVKQSIHKLFKPLNESIKVWKRYSIATWPKFHKSEDCPLCVYFTNKVTGHINCPNCPIAKFTDMGGCEFTPYSNYIHTLRIGYKSINTMVYEPHLDDVDPNIHNDIMPITKEHLKGLDSYKFFPLFTQCRKEALEMLELLLEIRRRLIKIYYGIGA